MTAGIERIKPLKIGRNYHPGHLAIFQPLIFMLRVLRVEDPPFPSGHDLAGRHTGTAVELYRIGQEAGGEAPQGRDRGHRSFCLF